MWTTNEKYFTAKAFIFKEEIPYTWTWPALNMAVVCIFPSPFTHLDILLSKCNYSTAHCVGMLSKAWLMELQKWFYFKGTLHPSNPSSMLLNTYPTDAIGHNCIKRTNTSRRMVCSIWSWKFCVRNFKMEHPLKSYFLLLKLVPSQQPRVNNPRRQQCV